MSKGRCLRAITAAAAAGLVLAACGGGGGPQAPSGLDPADRVPSSAILYVALTVKPQGSVSTDLRSAIDAVAGKGSARRLDARLRKSLSSTLKQVQGWAGQHIGVALTGWPPDLTNLSGQALADDVLFVAPTNDPAAARSFIAHRFSGPGAAGRVVGHYAIFGGQNAVGMALATTSGTSLAADPSYTADMSPLGTGELLTFYASLHRLIQVLGPLMKAQARVQGEPSQAQLERVLSQSPAGSSVAYGLSTTADQFRLDLVTHGTRSSGGSSSTTPADVASLPSGSWLAVALSGALANRTVMHSLTASLSQAVAASSPPEQSPAICRARHCGSSSRTCCRRSDR